MHIHRAVISGVGVAPHHIHQVLPAVHPPGVPHQQLDQVIFLGGEFHRFPVPNSHPFLGIQGELADGQQASLTPLDPGGPPQQCPDTGLQLQNVEGLGEIVVRAALKTHELVGVLALGRQHDDGHVGKLPDLHAGLQPVHLRHHHIQNDEVEPSLPGQLQRRRAVIGALHLVALIFQVEFHALYQGLFVIHH